MEQIKRIIRSCSKDSRVERAKGLYLHGNWVYIRPNEDRFLKIYIRMFSDQ